MNKLFIIICSLGLLSCGDGFLDVKPSSDTVVPTTLDDFQQLLDASSLKWAPELLDIQADDYYLTNTYWQSMNNVVFKNAYVWADDIYGTIENEDYGWNRLYEQIFYANVVLDGLNKVSVNTTNEESFNHVKGSALFVRAMSLHYLLQLYAPAYHPVNAVSDLGVPIPLSSDVNEKVKRESVLVCYKRLIEDLRESITLLREQVDFGRPSKVAAFALLARVYLMTENYESALAASKNSLLLYNDLTDFNLKKIRDYKEAIYFSYLTPGSLIQNYASNTLISEVLYNSYSVNDLRKKVYFNSSSLGIATKKDNYGLAVYSFSGLDTDEQYLIKAECEARLSDKDEAMKTLNFLLKHMYSAYIDKVVSTKEEALSLILQERRKQLIFRGVRWSDLKRYNRGGANITLTRTLGEKIYTLPPNSPKWLLPIPVNEIKSSGIQQNLRK